jgi:hypothetical protein
MQDITQEQLLQKIGRLPEDVRDAIYAPEIFNAIDNIAAHHQLDEVHIGLLTRLTIKLMAGVIAPNEFVTAIEEDLGIEREKVIRIVQEINHAILNPIKDSLLKVHAHTETSPAMQQITTRTIPDVITPPKTTQKKPIATTPVALVKSVTTPLQSSKIAPLAAPAIDPSPRTVSTPPSTLAAKLGNTYRIAPTVPQYGFTSQTTPTKVASIPPVPPSTPVVRIPEPAATAPLQVKPATAPISPPIPPVLPPVAPQPKVQAISTPPPSQPIRYVPPIGDTETARPIPSTPPVAKPATPTPQPPPPPIQPARYYPPAPPNLPQ